LATDRQTDKQTDEQIDSTNALSRSCCHERRLNKKNITTDEVTTLQTMWNYLTIL